MTIKILTIVGARPQFIKAAVVSRAFQEKSEVEEVILHTGQHYDDEMSAIFFDELKIPKPIYNLNVHGGSHAQMTGKMMEGIEHALLKEKPKAILVYGDTNSTAAGALAAAKLHIPVCHVESGLRSFNKQMPEEINRIVTDHLSSLLFCPTQTAIDNLKNEGITHSVFSVGDVMYDIILQTETLVNKSNILKRLNLQPKNYAVATVHRAENTNSKERFCKVINYLIQQSNELNLQIVLPLHPRAKQFALENQLDFGDLKICNPLGYLDMQALVKNATFVLTDSGGLQKEAYFYRVPCITLRDETEWVETIEAGWNRLWITADAKIPRKDIDDYGKGDSAKKIATIISDTFL